MTMLAVDTGAMGELSGRIRAAADEAAVVSGWTEGSAGLDRVLGAAVAGFLDAWQACLASAVDDARWVADAVDLAARAYQDVERVTAHGTPVLPPVPGIRLPRATDR